MLHRFEKNLKQKSQTTNTRQRYHCSPKRSNRWLMITTKNSHKMNLNKQKLAKFCSFHLLCQGFQLPDITGTDNPYGIETDHGASAIAGAFYTDSSIKHGAGYGHTVNENHPTLFFKASKSNKKYGNSSTVQPLGFQTLIIVRT